MGEAAGDRPAVVLVADDDAGFRSLVRAQLELGGYQVVEAVSGAAALARCRDGDVDLALLDVEMPGLTGHDVLRLLVDQLPAERVPVLLVSAHSAPEEVAEGLRLGAQDFVRKPLEPGELLARVRAALRIKALQDQLHARNEELERASRIDDLTGSWNRRHLEEHMTAAASFARRHQGSIAVLVVDVDDFKAINDRFGHREGDEVLRTLAARFRANTRSEDTVGRWGGDEFLVLLPNADMEGASATGEHLRAAAAGRPVVVGNRLIPVTVSIGCAAGAPVRPETLVVAADAALYRAKANGRNRVEIASQEPAGDGRGEPAVPQAPAALQETRDRFLSLTAHELMGPISVIKGWAVLLGDPRLPPDQRKAGLASLRESAEALEQLARDILDSAALMSGRLRLLTKRIDLADAVARALKETDDGRITVHPRKRPAVVADRARLEEMITHLAAHARRQAHDGQVVADVDTDGDDAVVVLVVAGAGHPQPPTAERRFEPSGNGARDTGEELYMARVLAAAHGGDVEVRSGVDTTELWLRLPLAAPESEV